MYQVKKTSDGLFELFLINVHILSRKHMIDFCKDRVCISDFRNGSHFVECAARKEKVCLKLIIIIVRTSMHARTEKIMIGDRLTYTYVLFDFCQNI